jgi:hypothetical protein
MPNKNQLINVQQKPINVQQKAIKSYVSPHNRLNRIIKLNATFWAVIQCSLVDIYVLSGGMYGASTSMVNDVKTADIVSSLTFNLTSICFWSLSHTCQMLTYISFWKILVAEMWPFEGRVGPRRAHPKGRAAGLQPPQTSKTEKHKNTDFVDIMISEVLRALPLSQNQALESADD